MWRLRTALCAGIVLLTSCSLLHDLDPDDLPLRDATDAAEMDIVLEPDMDVSVEPEADPEDDEVVMDVPDDLEDAADVPGDAPDGLGWACETSGFDLSCIGPMTGPSPATMTGCDLGLEAFADVSLTAGFCYAPGLGDECASPYEWGGFMVFYAASDVTPRDFRPTSIRAPRIYRAPPGGFPETFRVESRVWGAFGLDGEAAGVFAYEDDDSMVILVLYNNAGTKGIQVSAFVDEANWATPTERYNGALGAGTEDRVLTLTKTGATHWEAILDTATPDFEAAVDPVAVGTFVGNFPGAGTSATTVFVDYICISDYP